MRVPLLLILLFLLLFLFFSVLFYLFFFLFFFFDGNCRINGVEMDAAPPTWVF